MEETKRQSKKPLRKERLEEKLNMIEEEDNLMSSMISNIQIDPNSTRSQLNPKPEGVTDESIKGSAKSILNEICTYKRWKPPVYECSKVEGPCHMRLFTYKVVVEIRDYSETTTTTVVECFGDPKLKKKAAAEHAAEAALWYLELRKAS